MPLLRRGGHSQPWDAGADSVAAFFARLLLAVDVGAGFEARLADADPPTRYAACIDDLVGRYRASAALRDRDPAWWALLRREAERLARDVPVAWAAGVELGDGIRRPVAGQAPSMMASTASENGGHAASAQGP